MQGNWLAPLFPACGHSRGEWVATARRAGTEGVKGAIASAAPWAALLGLVAMALGYAEAETGFLPLAVADPTARLEGYRDLGAGTRRPRPAEGSPYVLTQGYALTSLMRFYGDQWIAVVHPSSGCGGSSSRRRPKACC